MDLGSAFSQAASTNKNAGTANVSIALNVSLATTQLGDIFPDAQTGMAGALFYNPAPAFVPEGSASFNGILRVPNHTTDIWGLTFSTLFIPPKHLLLYTAKVKDLKTGETISFTQNSNAEFAFYGDPILYFLGEPPNTTTPTNIISLQYSPDKSNDKNLGSIFLISGMSIQLS